MFDPWENYECQKAFVEKYRTRFEEWTDSIVSQEFSIKDYCEEYADSFLNFAINYQEDLNYSEADRRNKK